MKKNWSFFSLFFKDFLRFLLVLALLSKFEIFKTFLNNKISNLCLWCFFFYFNHSEIKFFAHTQVFRQSSDLSNSLKKIRPERQLWEKSKILWITNQINPMIWRTKLKIAVIQLSKHSRKWRKNHQKNLEMWMRKTKAVETGIILLIYQVAAATLT